MQRDQGFAPFFTPWEYVARTLADAAVVRIALDRDDVVGAFDRYGASRGYALAALNPSDSVGSWRARKAVAEVAGKTTSDDLFEAVMRHTTADPREDMLMYLTWVGRENPLVRVHFERLLARPDAEYAAHLALARLDAYTEPHTAQPHFEEALRLRPNSYEALIGLGDLQGTAGDARSALMTFRAAEGLYSDSVDVLVGLYRSLASTGAEIEARTILQKTQATRGYNYFPPYVSIYCGRRLFNNPDQAVLDFKSLLEIYDCYSGSLWSDPFSGSTWASMGSDLSVNQHYAEAILTYQRALRYAPDSIAYQIDLAEVRIASGDVAAGRTELGSIAARHPSDIDAQFAYGRALRDDRPRDAIPYLARVVQARPNDAEARFHLAHARAKSDDIAGAIRDFEMAHVLEPQASGPLFNLALFYAEAGQPEASRRSLGLLRAINPEEAVLVEEVLRPRAPVQPASPLGEGWTYASESSNTIHWAQTGRIRRTGSTLEVWVAGLPSAGNERAFREANDAGLTTQEVRRVAKTMTHYEVNCTGNRARILSSLVYDTAGSVLDQVDFSPTTWTAPVPETILEGIVDTVCAVPQ